MLEDRFWALVLVADTAFICHGHVHYQLRHGEARFQQLDHLIGADAHLFTQQYQFADRPLQDFRLNIGADSNKSGPAFAAEWTSSMNILQGAVVHRDGDSD